MKVFHATTHPTQPAQLGTPSGSAAMEALIGQPGSVQVNTVGVDWQANLSGVLNLKDPKAKAAGLTNRKEPIKIYAHVLRHPSKGFFLVDTGVSERFAHDAKDVGVGLMLRKYAGIQDMHTDPSTAQIIDAEGTPLAGVIMTHLHLDHVSGLPDIPQDTPIYVGAHEAEASLFLNLVARPTNNNLLAGRPPLQELQFEKDPDGIFEGVVDIFGDSSVFAIHTPGHTAGHISLVVRTPDRPVLLTGDVCHTRWGWDNGVEPGTFLAEREPSLDSLNKLKALSDRHPNMDVRLGHQA